MCLRAAQDESNRVDPLNGAASISSQRGFVWQFHSSQSHPCNKFAGCSSRCRWRHHTNIALPPALETCLILWYGDEQRSYSFCVLLLCKFQGTPISEITPLLAGSYMILFGISPSWNCRVTTLLTTHCALLSASDLRLWSSERTTISIHRTSRQPPHTSNNLQLNVLLCLRSRIQITDT